MKLVLFRHGDKKMDSFTDPDLSPKGHSQSQKIVDEILSKRISTPDVLISSPRKRTAQTLQKTADRFKLKILQKAELDQRGPKESHNEFRKRIQGFLITLQLDYADAKTIFLCTHIDWVEEFMNIIESSTDLSQAQFQSFGTAQWVEFEKNDLWDVVRYGQVNP